MNTDMSYIASIILGSIGIILLITTYVYIDKLEKIGCSCSVHPYRNFIKNYCLFAVVYIFATMLIPPKALVSAIGPIGVVIYFIVKVLFTDLLRARVHLHEVSHAREVQVLRGYSP